MPSPEPTVKIIDLVDLGQIEDVQQLIAKKYDVNQPDDEGNYPITVAASRNDLPMLKLLVKAGARIHQKNQEGENAHHFANLYQNDEMLNFIEAQGKPSQLKKM